MRKRYCSDGFIMCAEDYVSSFNFTCHDYDDSDIDRKTIRVYRKCHEDTIDIMYDRDVDITRLPSRYFEITANENHPITASGKYIPSPTVTVNGLEYIQCDKTTYDAITVYLIHYLPELGISESRFGAHNNMAYFCLVDKDYSKWTMQDYIEFIESSGMVKIKINDRDRFRISNIYAAAFDNKIYDYSDPSIDGLYREFYMNDTTVAADFVRQMRQRHPEIQFYTGEENRDSTKYNEWIKYDITPSMLKEGSYTFTSHVWQNALRDRFWETGMDVRFEYATNDLPTLMTRRDLFRVCDFLMKDEKFSYIIDNGIGEDFDIGYTCFWERNLNDEYGTQTSKDDTGYSTFTMEFTGHIEYMNLESDYFKRDPKVVEHVIYTLLYVPPFEDILKWDDDVILANDDLNFISWLKAYTELSVEFRNKFGIDIFIKSYIPTVLHIVETEVSISDQKDTINEMLTAFMSRLKSIGESAVRESNYVMVASLRQAKQMLDRYRTDILGQINMAEVGIPDFDVTDGEEPQAEDEKTLTIDTYTEGNWPDVDISDIEHPITEPEPTEPSEDTGETGETTEENPDMIDEPWVNTGGHYNDGKPHGEYDNNVVDDDGKIKQTVSGNNATINVDDDEILGDDEVTLDINLVNKDAQTHGIIL